MLPDLELGSVLLFPIDDKQSRLDGQDQAGSAQRMGVSSCSEVWSLLMTFFFNFLISLCVCSLCVSCHPISREPVFISFLSPQLALIVAQRRDKANNLSGILLTALDEGLKKIYVAARRKKGKDTQWWSTIFYKESVNWDQTRALNVAEMLF